MSLALEIEFLTGVCRAAREPGDDTPDWPPQPDRVFSALVASWAARGERADERMALEWLERQEPPKIRASAHTARTTPDVFVPPNDARSSSAPKTYLKMLPDRRPRQPRRFPVAVPDDPVVTMAWRANPEPAVLKALDAIARDVGYVGHSASVARLRFLAADETAAEGEGVSARRRVYPGRLAELERAHRLNPVRPKIAPGASIVPKPESAGSGSEAEDDWLVLEVVEGAAPDTRAAALVCRLLRQALMSGYRRAGLGSAIPETVSGHAPDGKPTRRPHLAAAPMAFAGVPHADGHTMGYALIPPAGAGLRAIPGFRKAFEAVAPYYRDNERRELVLNGEPLPEPLLLAPVGSEPRASLAAGPYLGPARIWASVTPLVLDRHLKRKDDGETRELAARACENAGLPRPEPDRIRIDKHSAVEGMPSARPPAGAPPWMQWKTPKALASRPLVHAVIDFGRDIRGPVLLGAGRFTGLGLCRGLSADRHVA